MLKYRVVLGWRVEFMFDDPDVAMNFAVQAAKARPDENEEQIRIELVTIEEEPEKEEGETEDV